MRFLSVCSGIEAASCAWHPLGWTCAGVSEIEAFPRAVLEQRIGAVAVDFEDHRHTPQSNMLPMFGDFTKIEDHHVGTIDLIVGGTPCQDYSIAGLRAGLGGNRGNLTLAFSDLAYRTRSRWLVWENVPGAFSTNEGRDFGAILATFSGRHGLVFEQPADGWGNAGIVEPAIAPDRLPSAVGRLVYFFACRVLDAQYFGIPQRRRRVFIVGYIGDWRPAAAVLFERESMQGNPAPRREKGQVATGYTPGSFGAYREGCGTLRANGGDFGPGTETIVAMAHGQGGAEIAIGGGAPTLTCNHEAPIIAGAICRDSFTGGMGGRPEGAAANHVIAFPAEMSGTQHASAQDVSPSLANSHTMAVAFKIGQGAKAGGIGLEIECAPTLTASDSGTQKAPGLLKGTSVRRLTPRECERLQGFPDDFTRIAWRGKPAEHCPDGPRYKALGNSMAVPVMRWIGERIELVETILTESAAA